MPVCLVPANRRCAHLYLVPVNHRVSCVRLVSVNHRVLSLPLAVKHRVLVRTCHRRSTLRDRVVSSCKLGSVTTRIQQNCTGSVRSWQLSPGGATPIHRARQAMCASVHAYYTYEWGMWVKWAGWWEHAGKGMWVWAGWWEHAGKGVPRASRPHIAQR